MKDEKIRLVHIIWHDAIHFNSGWKPINQYIKEASLVAFRKHYTCGYLIEETEEYVLIALDVAEQLDNNAALANQLQLIHKPMIVSMLDVLDQ